MTVSAAHVERTMKLADGRTFCACGRPWPCPMAGVCGSCGSSPCTDACDCDDCENPDRGWR